MHGYLLNWALVATHFRAFVHRQKADSRPSLGYCGDRNTEYQTAFFDAGLHGIDVEKKALAQAQEPYFFLILARSASIAYMLDFNMSHCVPEFEIKYDSSCGH